MTELNHNSEIASISLKITITETFSDKIFTILSEVGKALLEVIKLKQLKEQPNEDNNDKDVFDKSGNDLDK